MGRMTGARLEYFELLGGRESKADNMFSVVLEACGWRSTL